MVNYINIFVVFFGVAFLIALIDKLGRKVSLLITAVALVFNTYLSGYWLLRFIMDSAKPVSIFTAGFAPPFSINLQMGLEEAFILFLINLAGFLTFIFLIDKFNKRSINAVILFLMMLMGINGMILTRDIFNLFVFIEIASIATYGAIVLDENKLSLSAGFKYIMASGLASAFFLIGIIFIYHLTHSLNIDTIIDNGINMNMLGFLALFTLIMPLIIELKPFPANGWALDVYQAASSGIAVIIAVGLSSAFLFSLYKLLPLIPRNFLIFIGVIGLVTFFFSNLIGLKQRNAKRLLGYSSIAQMGLLTGSLAILRYLNIEPKLLMLVVAGFFINHFLAKAGLFWLSGIVNKDKISDWKILKKEHGLLIIFGTFIVALSSFPPFPAFWAKWEMIKILAANNYHIFITIILAGSLFELIYLFRWLGLVVKNKDDVKAFPKSLHKFFAPVILFLILVALSLITPVLFKNFSLKIMLPLYSLLILYVLDFLPGKIKGLIVIAGLSFYFYLIYPGLEHINLFFFIIFILGSAIQIITTLSKKGISEGFYPLLIALILSLGNLIFTKTPIQFFFSWEIMTLTSYFLVLRGQKAKISALKYLIFSTIGAYFVFAGFAYLDLVSFNLTDAFELNSVPLTALILLSLGFLIKSGMLGFHIWMPGAYGEAEDEFSPIISSVLSKTGLFGLVIISAIIIKNIDIQLLGLSNIVGWIAIFTTFFGSLMAVFQEDIKKLLAYSSMGQLGYMILTLATLSHLGWIASFYLAFNHLLFKGLIFIAIAGVISRVKTRNMYEMGGLIKKMPVSFVSVLIGIIALSGVPPLSGFGSKWLIYSALIEKGWYLQAALAFFSSGIAFLYLFRLIHSIFLGQSKPKHSEVREASIFHLIPQIIFIMAIMAISMFPNLITKPLSSITAQFIPSTVAWQNGTLYSSLGYWNGTYVMYITMGIFAIPLVWLILTIGKVQKVKQFNIVFAAERPFKPQTTHFAHNFFAHYRKAFGNLVKPYATTFWKMVSEWTNSLAASFRQIYSGNGQTYILHIVLYFVILYFLIGGKI